MSDVDAATDLVVLFKVLGSDTRLRLLHALHRGGEVAVGELAEQVGMRPQAVSNHLQRLADRGIVTARREGNRILYSIADACSGCAGPGVVLDRRRRCRHDRLRDLWFLDRAGRRDTARQRRHLPLRPIHREIAA